MFEGKKYLGGIFKSWPLGFDHNRRFDDAWEKENKFSSNRSTLECQRAKKRGSLINGSFNWPLLVSRRYLGNSWLEILPSSLSPARLLTWPVEWTSSGKINRYLIDTWLIDRSMLLRFKQAYLRMPFHFISWFLEIRHMDSTQSIIWNVTSSWPILSISWTMMIKWRKDENRNKRQRRRLSRRGKECDAAGQRMFACLKSWPTDQRRVSY